MTKPDCKLGIGYNANMLISEICAKSPEYLEIVYNNDDTPQDIKEVIKHYLTIKEKKEMVNREFVPSINGEEEKLKAEKDRKENKKEMAKSEKVKEETVILQPTCLLAKINAIRQAWSATEIEKAGKGKAGGGAKYDYYKPQQIIDFCLAQEVKHDLFSEFKINVETGFCLYRLIDIPSGEIREVECPFDIPRKMAASEAQQVGAAMTYHNRRLAMMMYRIEDNSKENVNVLEDADYSAPSIPAPPTIPTPPIGNQIVPPLPPSAPVSEPEKVEDKIQVDEPDVAEIAEQMAQAEVNAITPPLAPKVEATIPSTKLPDMSAYGNQTPPPPPAPPVKEPAKEPKLVNGQTPYMAPSDVMSGNKKSIEDLYS